MLETVVEEGLDNQDSDYDVNGSEQHELVRGTIIRGKDMVWVPKQTQKVDCRRTRSTSKPFASNDIPETFSSAPSSRSSLSRRIIALELILTTDGQCVDEPLSSSIKTPRRLTPQMMINQLHTIQTEEQKRFSKRRESLSLDSESLHLPSAPQYNNTLTSVQYPTANNKRGIDDAQSHIADEGTNPYAFSTQAELHLATTKLNNIIQQFQDIIQDLREAISPRRRLTMSTTLNPELLSLQQRLSRVHSVALTEHEMIAKEVTTRAARSPEQLTTCVSGGHH